MTTSHSRSHSQSYSQSYKHKYRDDNIMLDAVIELENAVQDALHLASSESPPLSPSHSYCDDDHDECDNDDDNDDDDDDDDD
eukprot:CAMPEP_0194105986 /NCGR_PEP_ID=MMETSP0150-20130528/6099_1 /TAXON_ID=122233 /ORGANISM="Chaetoceros debilis, Strain MM31A-1" /LENGTH=81 /DNA_ID=CAMNT_0038794013 /DNA_START=151 /DNA_END=393 /DNA_ORIENTATION=+